MEPNHQNRFGNESPSPTPEREAFETFSNKIESVVQEYMSVEEIDTVVRAGRVERALRALLEQVKEYAKQKAGLN